MHDARNLVRALKCLVAAEGRQGQAIEMAIAQGGPESAPAKILKTWALTPGSASPELTSAYRELIGLAERRSLIAQIRAVSAMRRVPFAVPILLQSTSGGAAFVGEGGLIPAAGATFAQARLQVRKVGAIIPETREFALLADGESFVTADLTRAIAAAESDAFISTAAGSDEAPAGILFGVTPGAGSTSPGNDVAALIDAFDGDLSAAVVLTSPRNGIKLHAAGFESTGARGGDLAGVAHVAHRSVPDGVIAIIDAGRILIADDSGLEIDVSGSASIDLGDTSGDATGELISMFQTNCTAFRALRTINWLAAAGAVGFLNSVNW